MNIVDEKDEKERKDIFHHGILNIHNNIIYKVKWKKKFFFAISFWDDIVNYNNIIVTLCTILWFMKSILQHKNHVSLWWKNWFIIMVFQLHTIFMENKGIELEYTPIGMCQNFDCHFSYLTIYFFNFFFSYYYFLKK